MSVSVTPAFCLVPQTLQGFEIQNDMTHMRLRCPENLEPGEEDLFHFEFRNNIYYLVTLVVILRTKMSENGKIMSINAIISSAECDHKCIL
jgi:hypothetical protein